MRTEEALNKRAWGRRGTLPFPPGPPVPKVGDRRSGPPEEVRTFPSRGIETFGASPKGTSFGASPKGTSFGASPKGTSFGA